MKSFDARWQRTKELFALETRGLQPRLHLVQRLSSLLPRRTWSVTRVRLFKLAGFEVGNGTLIHGGLHITGQGNIFKRLTIGEFCSIEAECVLDLEERITIGNRVTLGPGAMLLTSTHELGGPLHRAGAINRAPVTLGDGAWVGARCVILPGISVGAGAIVDAGSVVNKDVTSNTRVGGTPAVQLELL